MATDVASWAEISSETELREILGEVMPVALEKERAALAEVDRAWLAESPFCLVATCDADGNCDVSPKGDPAGSLVHVIDDSTIAIPERPGNRRADGFHNILSNPHVGLIFLIPGRGETLRVNGRARLVRDAPFMEDLAVKGRRPLMAMVVEIDTIFRHCSQAFTRSALWKTETWAPDDTESRPRTAKQHEQPQTPLEVLERLYGPTYVERLY